MLGLADGHQLAVQRQQFLHAAAELLGVFDGIDHGVVDGLAAELVELADGRPVLTGQRFTQGAAGCFKTLD
ncbi:hypothetical protein D3C80_1904620 [compost metagenome]